MARKSGSEEKTRRLVREMLAMIGSVPPETTPPEIAAELHKILFADTGHRDLFREEKDISTQIALQLLPEMQQLAASADDPFAAATLGVYLHSLAGLAASERLSEYAVTARDILDAIPQAIRQITT